MTQQTLTDALKPDAPQVSVDETAVENRYEEFANLTIPTHDNLQFNAEAWKSFIQNCSQYEASRIKSKYELTETEEIVLAGIEYYHGNPDAFTEAFTIQYENEETEWLDEKATSFIQEFGRRFVFAPILASWIPTIYICDSESYYDRVESKSSGYYHPTEHWIAIKFDGGDPNTEYWSVTRDVSRQYESSTTLHELGHAVHYLFSAQTEGSECVDNSDRTSENAVLSYKSIERTEWQSTFCDMAQNGYFALLDGDVTELRLWKQKQTVEEYLAEGFCAYLTAPRWLAQEQPKLHQAFDTLCS